MHNNSADAMKECGPGHPAHVRPQIAIGPKCGRVVAIRTGDTWNHKTYPNTYNLTFSDSKVDLRIKGDTLYNVPEKDVAQKIQMFFCGTRTTESGCLTMMINQGVRDCWIEKLTPTRCRIEYEMPNAGQMGGWRYQTTVGGYTYVAEW